MAPEVGGRNALDDPWELDDDPFDTTSKDWQAYYDSLEQLELEDSLATLPSGELHLVAVYGTLKQGRGNHDRHLSKATYIGDGVTDELYPMVVGGIPYLIDEPGKGHRVKVEVYQVDNAALLKLDGLEGHPGWYVRRKLKIRLTAGGSLETWVYTIPSHRRHTHMDDTGVYHNEF
jgi:gamma-glutamylaminecyclotransferase